MSASSNTISLLLLKTHHVNGILAKQRRDIVWEVLEEHVEQEDREGNTNAKDVLFP